MDEIISKLNAIEGRAASIMNEANLQKKALADSMAEKTEKWDSELLKDTDEKIAGLRSKMQASIAVQLENQKKAAAQELADIQSSYNKKHEQYAEDLFRKMIGD